MTLKSISLTGHDCNDPAPKPGQHLAGWASMFRRIRCPLDGWKFKWITGDGRFSTRVDSVSSRLTPTFSRPPPGVEAAPEALDHRHGVAPPVAHTRAARSAAIEPEHGANGDAEHRAAERVIVGEEIAHSVSTHWRTGTSAGRDRRGVPPAPPCGGRRSSDKS